MDGKIPSRFSTLRVFKLPGPAKQPPPLPPKDETYMSLPSTSQLTLNTSAPDLTPGPSLSRSPNRSNPNPYSSPPMSPYTASLPARSPQGASAFKKGLTMLSALGRRPNKSQPASAIPHSPSLSALNEQSQDADDDAISAPWNFKVCASC